MNDCMACGGTGRASHGGKCVPCNGKNYLPKKEKTQMSDLQQLFGGPGFDTHSVPPQEDFIVLPPGKYPVMIEKAEVKTTKSGTGHYLEVQLSVLDGQAKNRKVWDRINIQNPSEKCVEIGLRSLAALGQALGLASIQDTNQLLNGVCIACIKVKDEQNEVRTYMPLTSAYAPGVPQVPFIAPPPYVAPPAVYQPPASPTAGFYPPPAENTVPMPGPVDQTVTVGIKPPWAR